MGQLLEVHHSASYTNGQLLVEKLRTFLRHKKITTLGTVMSLRCGRWLLIKTKAYILTYMCVFQEYIYINYHDLFKTFLNHSLIGTNSLYNPKCCYGCTSNLTSVL